MAWAVYTYPAGQPGCYGIERRHGGKGPGATLSVLVVDPMLGGAGVAVFRLMLVRRSNPECLDGVMNVHSP